MPLSKKDIEWPNDPYIGVAYVSPEFIEAVKKEFPGLSGKVELILNQGGVRDGKIELKIITGN